MNIYLFISFLRRATTPMIRDRSKSNKKKKAHPSARLRSRYSRVANTREAVIWQGKSEKNPRE